MLVSSRTSTMVKSSSSSASAATESSVNKRKQTLPKSKPSCSKMCDKCEFSTNDESELVEHMKLEHSSDDVHFCDMCSFFTESFWDYQMHMEQHLTTTTRYVMFKSFFLLYKSNLFVLKKVLKKKWSKMVRWKRTWKQ